MYEIMLSITVPTYNHEKYIAKALDSILMQRTKYKYEVLVGEDASTDGTRAVLEKYEKDHPGKITVFYRKENLNNSNCDNTTDLKKRTCGKYLITLEGDDYWLTDDKIEKQISFLESHPDYVAVAHNCVVVDENNNPNGERYPECKHNEYTLDYFLRGIYPGQLASLMCRNYLQQYIFDNTIFEKGLVPGDKLLHFGLITNGKIYCMQENMSAYRHIKKDGSSYSANYKYDFFYDEHWYLSLLNFAYAQNNIKGQNCAEALYLGCLIHGIKEKKINMLDFLKCIKNINHFVTAVRLYTKRMYSVHLKKDGYAN